MARKEYDSDDPMEVVGVLLAEPPDDEAVAEMGRCFVEEMARMGWRRHTILNVFRSPLYQGPRMVLDRFGEEFVAGMIDRLEPVRRAGDGN